MLKNKVFIVILIILITICSFNLNSYAVSSDITTIEPQQLEISFNHYAKGDKVILTEINNIVIGQTSQLYAFIKQGNSKENSENQFVLDWYVKEIELDGLTWSSSDSSIATIDNDGKVTGIKKGYVTITASNPSGYTATKQIEIINADDTKEKGILIEPLHDGSDKFISVDEIDLFYVKLQNIPISEREKVKIIIEDTSVAEIEHSGFYDIDDSYYIVVYVKGLKEGSTKIAASIEYEDNTYTNSFSFDVIKTNNISISIQNALSEIKINNLGYFYVYFYNIPASENKNVKISVEDESIANVSVINCDSSVDISVRPVMEIIVKGLKEGTTKITASIVYNGDTYTDSFSFDVIKSLFKLEIVPEKNISSLKVNDTVQLKAVLRNSDGTNITQSSNTIYNEWWLSSNEKVAKVDNNGLVTAIGEGNAVITAKVISSDSETFTAIYNIKVTSTSSSSSNKTGERLPKTGLNEVSAVLLIIVIGISIFTYIKYRKYKNI